MSDNNDTIDMDADAVAELKVRCEQLERELIQVKHRADT